MAVRFDGERFALELSVQDLLDVTLLRSLGFANRGGYERLWLGQAIHSRYQERALAEDPTYRREVVVAVTFDHRGWEVTISGRVDGLRRDAAGRTVVEEIKSVRRGGQLSPLQRELYERQAALYAWLLHRRDGDEGAAEVTAELVLIEIGGEGLERIALDLDLDGVERSVRRRLNTLLAEVEREREAAAARREAAQRLVFPYPGQRPGQETIVAAVEAALAGREHLLVEAPTGLGKTAAALYPALAYALAHDKRVFVLTAKTLQQEMATKVVALLNAEGAFRSLRLRAKAKMCANDQILCHEEYCPYARDYFYKLATSGIVGKLRAERPHLEPDEIFARARAAEVCPFELSLELAGRAQVVVCDYNYAFEPYVSLAEFGEDADLSDTVLVIDEVHNLVGRGRDYYSPALAAATAREAAEATLARGGGPVHRRIAELCLKLAATIESAVDDALELGEPGRGEDGVLAAAAPLPEEAFLRLRPPLDEAFVDLLEWNRETRSFRAEDPFVDLYFDFLRFLAVLAQADGAFSQCVERRRDGGVVRVLCKDPSRFLGAVIARTHSTIGLSATLSPPEFYRDLAGFAAARTSVVTVPSPFPPANRRVVIDPSILTTYRERPAYYQPIADRLAGFAAAVPGNCLALFPSYRFLAEIAARLPPGGKRVLVQQQTAGDRERDEILAALRATLFGDVLLLAVAGGVFAEGVDYPGDSLRGVAIVGPCLPGLSLEQRLLADYYEERFERGFEYAFVVPGMTRVVQAAGRLIRSAEDTGVIALLDRRFLHPPYRDHLPADWLDGGEPGDLTGDAAQAALNFFKAHPTDAPVRPWD